MHFSGITSIKTKTIVCDGCRSSLNCQFCRNHTNNRALFLYCTMCCRGVHGAWRGANREPRCGAGRIAPYWTFCLYGTQWSGQPHLPGLRQNGQRPQWRYQGEQSTCQQQRPNKVLCSFVFEFTKARSRVTGTRNMQGGIELCTIEDPLQLTQGARIRSLRDPVRRSVLSLVCDSHHTCFDLLTS